MGDVSAEPSMEDILASIKRIIAEEAEPVAATRTRRSARDTAPSRAADDVLELSEPAPAPARAAAAPPPEPSQVAAAASTPAPVPTSAPTPVPQPSPREPILSSTTADASRHSLEMLSRLVVKPETPGGDTLEGMVREMLRPMLREWLDAHLPEMVEAMVAREIARIGGQV